MKTILDKTTRDEIISRIENLNANSQRQWGEMNVYEMLRHCILAEELYMGKIHCRRSLLGRFVGQAALNKMLKDETPMSRNAPTNRQFLVKGWGNVAQEKINYINLLREYENYNSAGIIHWFFGYMTKEQIGKFSYKHLDHHLRQFGC